MWEILHLFLGKARSLPVLHPWPGLDVCNTVFALFVARQILFWLACVLSTELNFEDAEHAQCLVAEAVDRVWDLLWCGTSEVIDLACEGKETGQLR